MAATASPFGMRPVNMIGGAPNRGGAVREYKLPSNVAAAYYTGQIIYMAANGVPTAISGSPTAPQIPSTSADATAGILGVMVGVRYVDPTMKYSLNASWLPANAITNGYTDVYIQVNDDPNQLYMIQAATAVGSKTNGARGAIGQNVAVSTFTGSTTTGVSAMAAATGSNWASCASTTTLALRIVDIATPDDTYPELIVKFNAGLHSYTNPLGV